jgi:hypothetical protein
MARASALCGCVDDPKAGIHVMTNSSNGEGIFKELLATLLRIPTAMVEWEGYTRCNELPPRDPGKRFR